MIGRFILHLLVALIFFAVPASRAAGFLNESPFTGYSSIPPVAPSSGKGLPSPLDFPQHHGKLYLVVVDRLSIGDLSDRSLPTLFNLARGSAVGLMSTTTAGSLAPENCHATIGAGAPLVAPKGLACNSTEELDGVPAGQIYFQRTGLAVPSHSVVYLNIAQLYELNSEKNYSALPGALGTSLREAGCRITVLGNSDSIVGQRRNAVLLAMDNRGMVERGSVGPETLVQDPSFPGGQRTNYSYLVERVDEFSPVTDVFVIELGDLARLEDSVSLVFEDVFARQRHRALERIDRFLNSLVQRMDSERDLLVIISPTPMNSTVSGMKHIPLVLLRGAGVSPGLLTSPSTRRPGIVKNYDLAPTLMSYFGLAEAKNLMGRPVQWMAGEGDCPARLADLQRELNLTYSARAPVLKGYAFVQLVVLSISLLCIFRKLRIKTENMKPVLMAVMAVPVVLLVLSLLPRPTLPVFVAELICLTVLITVAASAFHRGQLDSFVFLGFFTSGLLIIDTFRGSPLQKLSVLGYDPIVGARFYGIGNEYMGVILGSSIVAAAALIDRFPRYRRWLLSFTMFYFGLILYIMGAPYLGTNLGGTVAAAVAFMYALLLLCRVKFNVRTILFIAAGSALIVGAFVLYDLQRLAEQQSHFGRTASLILQGGVQDLVLIIKRKAEMNIKLMKYTIWSRVLLFSLGSLALLSFRPVGIMESVRKKYPNLYCGFMAVVVGSIVALIFNDSGVVAAATTMIFGVPPIIYLMLHEIEKSEERA